VGALRHDDGGVKAVVSGPRLTNSAALGTGSGIADAVDIMMLKFLLCYYCLFNIRMIFGTLSLIICWIRQQDDENFVRRGVGPNHVIVTRLFLLRLVLLVPGFCISALFAFNRREKWNGDLRWPSGKIITMSPLSRRRKVGMFMLWP
jgi:hypothetical protein